jgi:hypothetical protein
MTTRLDGFQVAISGDDSYEAEVKSLLDKILRTQTGKAIDTKIRAHGGVLVVPYTKGDFNAQELSDEALRSWYKIAVIEFSPSTFEHIVTIYGLKMPDTRAMWPGMEGDEALFHEMVHAARFLGHDLKQTPLTGTMAPYEDEEEFFAIMVTNIYESEKGKTFISLRRSHFLEPQSLTAADAVSETFLYKNDNYRLIDKFCNQHPSIAPMIANVPAKFNPIRAYFKSKEIIYSTVEPIPLEYRTTQHEERPALTDDFLLSLLEPRYHAADVAGYGARARKLEEVFRTLSIAEAIPLFTRLQTRAPGDKVAMYFHDHLATATRQKLLDIARTHMH